MLITGRAEAANEDSQVSSVEDSKRIAEQEKPRL